METLLAGRYRIIQPLGSGGFGQTFLATDDYLPGQPPCVVKQFKPRSNVGDSLRAAKRLFDQEAEILYRLGNHDRIPRLLAHFEQDDEFYLVQEFVPGESLQQEFSHHFPFNEAEVVSLLRDVLDVLAVVHEQQVIHRDIKPSNLIRRDPDRHIVLIDFGAVKQVTVQSGSVGESGLTVAVGSPGYMPPEQLASRPHFSSDIYALGIVALQALTGLDATQLPHDESTGELACSTLGDRLTISPQLATILDNMVRYDYRQRYANAKEALHALATTELATLETDTVLKANPAPSIPSAAPTYYQSHRQPQHQDTRPPAQNSFIQILSPEAEYSPAKPPRLAPPTLSSQAYRNRQALLNKVKNFWVKGVLETSLYDQVLIVLGLETRPESVIAPWHVALANDDQRLRTLPQGTQVTSIFDQMGTGRSLLILGEPGAGKTTTLLQLARNLIGRAEQDVNHLIPVILNLSSWTNPTQPIATWIVDELNTKYQVPKAIGQAWLRQQQLLLLLDGLDEVRQDARNSCVAALNAFQQEYSSELVVCSRIRDYEQLSHRLNVQTAIYLRSLTPEQIQLYLDSLGAELTGLKQLLREDEALRELAQSPLLLNIMVLAYQGMTPEDLPKATMQVERRKQVFDAYIDRMLQRQGNRLYTHGQYTHDQIRHWLSWLAQQLMQHSQTIFLIERLDRHWLQTNTQRWRYTLISTSMIGLFMGLTFGLAMGWSFGLQQGILAGLVAGFINLLLQIIVVWMILVVEQMPMNSTRLKLEKWAYSISAGVSIGTVFGLLAGLLQGLTAGIVSGFIGGVVSGLIDWRTGGTFTQSTLDPTERLQWSWQNIKAKLIFWLPVGTVTGFVYHLLGATSVTLPIAIFSGWLTGLIAGILTGLSSSSEIETKTIPNQGTWQSAQNFLLVALMGTLLLSLAGWLLNMPIFFAIIFGLLISLSVGGSGCVVHFSLRLVCWCDRHMPWNYARFLNYATQLTFLQKVGGGYIFTHRLLMEHFAQNSFENVDQNNIKNRGGTNRASR